MAMDSPYSEAQFQKAPKVNMFLSLPKKKKKPETKEFLSPASTCSNLISTAIYSCTKAMASSTGHSSTTDTTIKTSSE